MRAAERNRASLFLVLAALAAATFVLALQTRAAPPDAPAEAAAAPVIGPYVNSVTPDSAKIVWAAAGGTPAVSVAPTSASPGGPSPLVAVETFPITGRTVEKLHVATVTGLRPSTTYTYRVAAGGGAESSFQTAPPAASKGPLKFVAYSDPQTYPERHRQVVQAVIKELPFAFLAISGDLAEDSSDWNDLKKDFFDPAADLLRRTALWTARGNHEKDGVLYRDVFALPGNELYYSFDYGNLHYVMLDCYKTGSGRNKDQAEMAEMIAWLEKDLTAARGRADWLIVSYHEPTINAGARGSDWGREDLLPVLEKHGVDIVLCGHSHIYERIRPVGPRGGKPIIHITHGGGGGPTYPIAPSPILETSYSGLHYCLFTIEGNRLDMVARTPDGKLLDHLSLVKIDGRFQKEVMDRIIPSDEVGPLVKVFKIHRLTLDRLPDHPGQPVSGIVPAGSFPPGYRVTIGAAADCPWKLAPMDFVADGGPVTLQLTPPEGMKVSVTPWMGTFEPPLSLKIGLTREGASSSCDSVPVQIPPECLRQIVQVPPPVGIPPAPAAIAVDGRLDDWQTVPPLRLPTGEASRTLRLAWKPDGLYGAFHTFDPDIRPNAKQPWTGDALRLDFEMDRQRRFGIRSESKATMAFLYPGVNRSDDRPGVFVQAGDFQAKSIDARWQKTDKGYLIEFHVAAAALAPAKLVPGGRIGFNFVVHDGPDQVTEQFIEPRGVQSTWGKPVFWGLLEFAKD